ncbi:MAG: phosphatidate cytidylyltransferase [Alphaproteobacteria bacterium]
MSSIAANGGMAQSTGSGLALRVLSAAALIPLVLALVWVGSWPFVALIALVVVLMGVEWHQLTLGDIDREATGTIVFLAGAVLVLPMTPVWAAPLVLAIGAAAALVKTDAKQRPWRLLPFLWLGLPACALVWLRLQPEIGLWLVGWLLATVWASDTGAYFAGRGIGGPKLAPRISPNKTWAGLIGGMVAAAIAGGAVAAWGGFAVLPAAGLSAVVAALSQGGDLAESMLKRRFDVKDSGTLIPGHGGILDRVDALLAAAPATAALYALSHGRWPLW